MLFTCIMPCTDASASETFSSRHVERKPSSAHYSRRRRTKLDKYEMSTGFLLLNADEGNGGISPNEVEKWTWAKGFKPPDNWTSDSQKMQLLLTTQAEIDRAPLDYHCLAKESSFLLDKKTICRYLEAAQWNPVLTNGKTYGQRIMETIQWRVNYPIPFRDKALLRKELATGKQFYHGKAKNGSSVVYLMPARQNTSRDVDANVLSLIYTIERAIQQLPPDVVDIVCIVDCKGVGMMNSPPMAFITNVIDIMGKHMPRRLGQLFVVNVSSAFYFVWNVISSTLSEMTRNKVKLLTSSVEEMRTVIGQVVDMSQLLEQFGGSNTFQFNVDRYLDEDVFLSCDRTKWFLY